MLFAFVAALSGVVSYWAMDREPPLELYRGEAMNSPVRAGDVLKIKFFYNRHKQCQVKVDRYIVDSSNVQVTLVGTEFAFAPGSIGPGDIAIAVDIPKAMSQGRARYLSVRYYQCNPVHWIWPIVVDGPVVDFIIQGVEDGEDYSR